MNLRIARKIYTRMGHGYPIDDTQRLQRAVNIMNRKFKRSFKEWHRCTKRNIHKSK